MPAALACVQLPSLVAAEYRPLRSTSVGPATGAEIGVPSSDVTRIERDDSSESAGVLSVTSAEFGRGRVSVGLVCGATPSDVVAGFASTSELLSVVGTSRTAVELSRVVVAGRAAVGAVFAVEVVGDVESVASPDVSDGVLAVELSVGLVTRCGCERRTIGSADAASVGAVG